MGRTVRWRRVGRAGRTSEAAASNEAASTSEWCGSEAHEAWPRARRRRRRSEEVVSRAGQGSRHEGMFQSVSSVQSVSQSVPVQFISPAAPRVLQEFGGFERCSALGLSRSRRLRLGSGAGGPEGRSTGNRRRTRSSRRRTRSHCHVGQRGDIGRQRGVCWRFGRQRGHDGVLPLMPG